MEYIQSYFERVTQTLFSMDNMELEIVLFPYTTYLMRKNPELVLIHFPNSTYSELKRRKEQLEDICQNAIVTMPRSNTDIFLQEQVISRGKNCLDIYGSYRNYDDTAYNRMDYW